MFHGTMTLNKDRNELSTKKAYYNDRDYRKNAFLKNKNLKIKRLLTFSWHGRHLGLPWLTAGSCHRPPQTNLQNFCLALSRCFTGFILSYAQEQRVKTPRRKAILRGKFQQLERQHNTRKGLLLPSFLPGGGIQQTFTKKLPLLYTFYWQIVPFHIHVYLV